jgi:hypothetical protein
MASGILSDLVELLGHRATIDLVRAWGGRRVKVPATMREDHALVFTVGWDAARKLASAYGGAEGVDLPAERNALLDLRNEALAQAFLAGRSISWTAQEYGLSRRQVNSVLDRLGYQDARLARAAVATRT